MAWGNKQAWVLGRPRISKALSFVRGIYPVLLFGYFFTSGHAFNRIIVSDWLDPWFMSIDKGVFGYYPSLEWGKTYSNWAIQELFHFAYFCYYPMIVGLPVYLYFKQPKAFKELIFNLTFVFYLCYTIYSVLPVIGGRYIPEAMELTKTYRVCCNSILPVYSNGVLPLSLGYRCCCRYYHRYWCLLSGKLYAGKAKLCRLSLKNMEF
jgi:hypothetical protein